MVYNLEAFRAGIRQGDWKLLNERKFPPAGPA
jgi:hypothetical protein